MVGQLLECSPGADEKPAGKRELLGIPIGTVKSRANAALGKMKAQLSDSKRP